MRTVINLILTLMVMSPVTAIIFTVTLAAWSTFHEDGRTVLACLTPLFALIILILAFKLIYKAIRFLTGSIFP